MSFPFGLISALTPNGAVAPVTESRLESADKNEDSVALDTRLNKNHNITSISAGIMNIPIDR